MMNRRAWWAAALAALLFAALPAPAATGAGDATVDGWRQVLAVVDVRSTVSDGAHDFDALAELARKHGVEALFLSDHDRLVMEYGLFPLRRLLKKREERPAVATIGAGTYLARIAAAQQRAPDVLLVAGVEAAPFYYWSGLPFVGDGLIAHQWERHLLVYGLDGDALARLPVLHNDRQGLSFHRQPLRLLFFAFAALIGLIAVGWGGRFRAAGLLLATLALVLALNDLHVGTGRFDQYHGDQGSQPWQDCIDGVAKSGGLCFWNHPETGSGRRRLGPLTLDTPPYPELLQQTDGYTGFAAIYGDRTTATEPGGPWDALLLQYCRGIRQRPPVAIAAADFHREGKDGEMLGNFATVLLVREKTEKELLVALAAGRSYALRGHDTDRDLLRECTLTAAGGSATIGGRLILDAVDAVTIHAVIDHQNDMPHQLTLRLIRDGELIAETTATTPIDWWVTDGPQPAGSGYYRLEAIGTRTRILTNPIFVARSG